MSSQLPPQDDEISIADLVNDPYPIYRRLRAETPVLRVKSVGRTMLTKAGDTRHVKENPELFSSNDPNTPMKRAFRAHTLMRKDGEAHRRERMAMAMAFGAKVIQENWIPAYRKIAATYLDRLPAGEPAKKWTCFLRCLRPIRRVDWLCCSVPKRQAMGKCCDGASI